MHVFGRREIKCHTHSNFRIFHISVKSTFIAGNTTKQNKSAARANLTKSFVPMTGNTYYWAPLMSEHNGCFEQAHCKMAVCCSGPVHGRCQGSSNKSHHLWLISILEWPGPKEHGEQMH